jgi:hypothetical protein
MESIDESGRTLFDTATEGFQKLDDLACAVIKVAGEVGERMHAGATSTDPLFNWFNEGGDAEDARPWHGGKRSTSGDSVQDAGGVDRRREVI